MKQILSVTALIICAVLFAGLSISCREKEIIVVEGTVVAPESRVPNVHIVKLNYTPQMQGPFKRLETFYITDIDNADALFEASGFPENIKETYNAEWFQKSNLAAVILFTNPVFGHSVKSMEISQDTVSVSIQEIEPNAHNSLGTFKAILVGIPKEEAPAAAEVKAEIERVVEGK